MKPPRPEKERSSQRPSSRTRFFCCSSGPWIHRDVGGWHVSPGWSWRRQGVRCRGSYARVSKRLKAVLAWRTAGRTFKEYKGDPDQTRGRRAVRMVFGNAPSCRPTVWPDGRRRCLRHLRELEREALYPALILIGDRREPLPGQRSLHAPLSLPASWRRSTHSGH